MVPYNNGMNPYFYKNVAISNLNILYKDMCGPSFTMNNFVHNSHTNIPFGIYDNFQPLLNPNVFSYGPLNNDNQVSDRNVLTTLVETSNVSDCTLHKVETPKTSKKVMENILFKDAIYKFVFLFYCIYIVFYEFLEL